MASHEPKGVVGQYGRLS